MQKENQPGNDLKMILGCPNCGKPLAMNERCSCDNPVTIITMVGCKKNYLAYIDSTGNVWRVAE